MKRTLIAVVVAVVLGLGAPTASATLTVRAGATPTSGGHTLFCHAKMSNAKPKQYSTTSVLVTSWGDTEVTTSAHYRTTTTTHHGETNNRNRGTASIRYYISGATIGYRVIVDVSVRKGSRHASCSTNFIPRSDAAFPQCSVSASSANDGYPGDYYVNVQSNQPDAKATASDSSDTWSDDTNASGSVSILLYYQSPGEQVTVTVGAATCFTSI